MYGIVLEDKSLENILVCLVSCSTKLVPRTLALIKIDEKSLKKTLKVFNNQIKTS